MAYLMKEWSPKSGKRFIKKYSEFEKDLLNSGSYLFLICRKY